MTSNQHGPRNFGALHLHNLGGTGTDLRMELELDSAHGQAMMVWGEPMFRLPIVITGELELRDFADNIRQLSKDLDENLAAGFGKHIAKPAPREPSWLERQLRP